MNEAFKREGFPLTCFVVKNSKPYQNGINKTFEVSKSQCLSRFFDFNCHGAKSFILVWCEVVYPHRFSVLRLRSPSARHLPARYRGLEDGSLRPFYSPNSLLLFTPLSSPPSRTQSRLRRRLASVSSLSFVSLSP